MFSLFKFVKFFRARNGKVLKNFRARVIMLAKQEYYLYKGSGVMETEKLNRWADLLLDTGKRNNLINFKDAKMGAVEVLCPDFSTLFSKAEHAATFEVFDPKLNEEEDSAAESVPMLDKGAVGGAPRYKKEEYLAAYAHRLKKSGQILIYNPYVNPLRALKNIRKKAITAIEERGVNIAYMAFGFIRWTEGEDVSVSMRAPLLLLPISIENESAIDPFHIKITDSEMIVNPTFLFKLKNEYGVELPEYDEEGVEEYLEKIEEKLSKLKWSVERECKIATFSFLKINMHKDLKDNAPKILQNPEVQALLGEGGTPVADGEMPLPQDLFTVVDADSSQTEAIRMAHSGKSFVLQGPPGTGKSQTITNVIAESLADGKKVLFVSEKLAALNVVYDKLKKAGLDEFCLQLHSHKANKKEVIDELCHTLKAQKSGVSQRAQKETESKLRLQKELDEYTRELHALRPTVNKSLYEIYEELSALRNAPETSFVINNVTDKGEEHIERAEEALLRYQEYTAFIGSDYRANAWYGYENADASYQERAETEGQLGQVLSFLNAIQGVNRTLNAKHGLKATSLQQVYALRDFLRLATESAFLTPVLLKPATLQKVISAVENMRALAKEILEKKGRIDGLFDGDVYLLDGAAYHKALTKRFNGFFSRIFSGEYRKIREEMRFCKKDGKRITYAQAVAATHLLMAYQRAQKEFSVLEERTAEKLGDGYQGVNTDFAALAIELERLKSIHQSELNLSKLSSYSKSDFQERKGDLIAAYGEISAAFAKGEGAETALAAKFRKEKYDVRNAPLDAITEKYRACMENADKLSYWCEFLQLQKTLAQLEVKTFVDYAILKKLPAKQIAGGYKKAFYAQWVDALLHENPTLNSFSRIPHDQAVKGFKEKDVLGFEINKARIKAKLSAERPNVDMVAQGSAVALLLREGEKKRKKKGIRLLLEEIGDLVQTLKPCFLMSPLSVSTYLSADMTFDVVVFDEASQIFPQDAVGAIYRGKQLIVVGDSKQMPPSNFFNSMALSEEEEEVEDVTDYESILDLCAAAFPQKRLKWHYRSRFEPLIAFSNKNFYDNDLITFPSPGKDGEGMGVDYYYVDGVFDRKTKTNQREAEKIVELVFRHIEKYPERSLGVVAFSISQQNLIEKLIAKKRKQNPEKEAFFKGDRPEPFFVKNLETVQGDERDTMIFSIAYAKDEEGRLLLNFGPLNREGGERRLNVAVTRAKCNVQVVSSMHGTDIDVNKAKSVGARLLREYLLYAENGETESANKGEENEFNRENAPFEQEVGDFLREKGFAVDQRVGASSAKICLAVKHPKTQDYVLAVECDGAAYRGAKNTRDRDRLRQEVLERMGWQYYRVWSTDWNRNKRTEKENLLQAVTRAMESAEERKKKVKEQESPSFEETALTAHFAFPKYDWVDEQEAAKTYNYDPLRVIGQIVEREAPVSEEWLLKRIAFLFGREKVTSVVREEYEYIMLRAAKSGIQRKNGFLYLNNGEIPMLRVPKEDVAVLREVKYIPVEELALGMKEILKQNFAVEKSGLFRLTVKELGFSRMGDTIVECLENALQSIEKEIVTEGEMISLKQK